MPPPRKKPAAKSSSATNEKKQPRHRSNKRQADAPDEEEEDLFSRNKQRYDHVESYEYQMPDNFEDEEIDEEAAFTEDDKKKYAAWFDKDEDDDEDEEGIEEGEDELDLMESEEVADEEEEDQEGLPDDGEAGEDEEEEDVEEDEAEDEADEDKEEEDGGAAEDDDGFLDDLLGASDDDDDEEADDLDKDDEDEDEDEPVPTPSFLKALRPPSSKPQQRVISEAYPESEFALNPGASSSLHGESSSATVSSLLANLIHPYIHPPRSTTLSPSTLHPSQSIIYPNSFIHCHPSTPIHACTYAPVCNNGLEPPSQAVVRNVGQIDPHRPCWHTTTQMTRGVKLILRAPLGVKWVVTSSTDISIHTNSIQILSPSPSPLP